MVGSAAGAQKSNLPLKNKTKQQPKKKTWQQQQYVFVFGEADEENQSRSNNKVQTYSVTKTNKELWDGFHSALQMWSHETRTQIFLPIITNFALAPSF